MSRIGKSPIAIPAGVTVRFDGGAFQVKGPKGELSMGMVDRISCEISADTVVFTRDGEDRVARANHGLMRSLAANMVHGVSEGFSKRLEVNGIGYRADVKGGQLVMNLGYSHLINYDIPSDVSIEAGRDNKITVSGIDKQQVGQVAAIIRGFRPPDRYKGKGVRYEGEHIALKTGKSA